MSRARARPAPRPHLADVLETSSPERLVLLERYARAMQPDLAAAIRSRLASIAAAAELRATLERRQLPADPRTRLRIVAYARRHPRGVRA